MVDRIDGFCETMYCVSAASGAFWIFDECIAIRRLHVDYDPRRRLRAPVAVLQAAATVRTCWRRRHTSHRAIAAAHGVAALAVVGVFLWLSRCTAQAREEETWLSWAIARYWLGRRERDVKWLLVAHQGAIALHAYAPAVALVSVARRAAARAPNLAAPRKRPPLRARVKRRVGSTVGSLVPLSIVLSWSFWSGFTRAAAARLRAALLSGQHPRKRGHS